jgi:Flp pilus assembly protein TadD
MALLLYVRALAKQHGGDAMGADADLRKAQLIDPDEASSLFNRSIAKRALGDIAGADADVARAKAINPKIGQ